ncbi:MAG: hypothetical protein U0V87_03905 [Acidobacteriota bacterium]
MSRGPAFDAARPTGASMEPAGGGLSRASALPLITDVTPDKSTVLEILVGSALGRWACHLVPYMLVGQTWGWLWWGLQRLFDPLAPRPDLSGLASVPGRMVVFHLLIVTSWLLPQALRGWGLSGAALLAAVGLRFIDAGSAVLFLGVCAAAYPWLKLAVVPRWVRLVSVFALVGLTRLAAQWLGFTTLARPDIAVGFAVCLWYACYALTGNQNYGLARHLGYLHVRLFTEGPVFSPDELGLSKPQSLLVPALRALTIAMLARSVAFHLHQWLDATAWRESIGASLLGFSYLNYIALSCDLVFGYNMALGLLRLAGLPIRDNFGAWFLACTPNDHWRRWNLLYREWILTFTFYPLMRARRGLFQCIMSALLASGLMHLFALIGSEIKGEKVGLTLLYWTINGLAIYLVLAVPRYWPRATQWLQLGSSRVWMVVGWLATSSFYAAMFFVNQECGTFQEVAAYLARLAGQP